MIIFTIFTPKTLFLKWALHIPYLSLPTPLIAVETIPSLSLSLSRIPMGRGIPFPAGLTLLVAQMLLLQQICSAKDAQHCAPSSCGDIRNVSYPFRLKDDPPNCGDFRYNLSCENNRTVLDFFPGSKYYVKEIDYDNFTIRFVDGGVIGDHHQDNYSSVIPRYFLTRGNISSDGPYDALFPDSPSSSRFLSDSVVFVHCEKPVKSELYLNISACFDTNGVVYSSNNSKRYYRYVLFYDPSFGDIEESCQVQQMSLLALSDLYLERGRGNISCTDLQELLAFGFKVSWYRVYCGSCTGSRDRCYVDKEKKFHCSRNGTYNNIYLLFLKNFFLSIFKYISIIIINL